MVWICGVFVRGEIGLEEKSHQKFLSFRAKQSTSGRSSSLVLGSDRGEFFKFEPPHHSTLNTLQPDFEKNPFFVSTFLHPANVQTKLTFVITTDYVQIDSTNKQSSERSEYQALRLRLAK